MTLSIGILASGRGSNFGAIQRAIVSGELNASIKVLITDRPTAQARGIARIHDIPDVYIPYDKNNRVVFEQEAERVLKEQRCDLVVLAGFMRLITPWFIQALKGRVLNIHPSLLPSFKGLHAQKQALDFGVKIAGCTVHVVTEEMDSGPIIGQRTVSVLDGDTEETLSARILVEEHKLYPECIEKYGGLL